MKKSFVLILTALLLITVFTGCSKKSDSGEAAKPVEAFYNAIVTQNRDKVSSITCADSDFTAYGDVGAVAIVDGGSFAYVNNQRVRLEKPVFSEALSNFNFSTRASEEVKRDLYVPVSALSLFFGAEVELTQ